MTSAGKTGVNTACGGADVGKTSVEAEVLRAIDACGGADDRTESADWNRGYNDALAAATREVTRLFERRSA